MIHPGKLCFPGCFLFAAPRRGTPNSQKKTSAFPEAGKALVLLFAWYLLPQGGHQIGCALLRPSSQAFPLKIT